MRFGRTMRWFGSRPRPGTSASFLRFAWNRCCGLACAFAAFTAGHAGAAEPEPEPLDFARGLWIDPSGMRIPRSCSFIAVRHSGHLGESLTKLGDLQPDGVADFAMGGGRSGTNSAAGAAFVVEGRQGPGLPRVTSRLEGPDGRPGFGRLLAAGPAPGGGVALAVGKPDQEQSNPLLECWSVRDGEQTLVALKSPPGTAFRGLQDVALPGDLDGDGRVDMVLSGVHEDRLWVGLHGGFGSGFRSTPSRRWTWGLPGSGSFVRLLAVGDVDGDGTTDLVLSLPAGSDPGGTRGRVVFWTSRAQTAGTVPTWHGEDPVDEFGRAMVVADLLGSPSPELVIGAPGAGGGTGAVWIFAGRAGGWEAEPTLILRGEKKGARFGETLAAGRLRGKAAPALLAIGAPDLDEGAEDVGRIYLTEVREPGGDRDRVIDPGGTLRLVGDRPRLELGRRILIPGDTDGDGCDDLVVSIHRYGHWQNNAGRVDILFGSTDWPSTGAWMPAFPRSSPPAPEESTRLPDALSAGRDGARAWWWGAGLALSIGGLALIRTLVVWTREIEARAKEAERRRIARDLHDELGADLGALARMGTAAEGEAARNLAVGIERTIWELRPEMRTPEELACALMDLAPQVLAGSSMRCRFEFPEEAPRSGVAQEGVGALFRAAQEAINNARKHSGGTVVTLGMECRSEGLVLTISDDGRGGSSLSRSRPGLGLATMSERLKEVGGSMSAGPNAHGGVTVRLEVPWQAGGPDAFRPR